MMTDRNRRNINLSLGKSLIGLGSIIFSSIFAVFVLEDQAIAQAADVPKSNASGDFSSIFMQGNRGFYAVQKWLIIQAAESGVNGDFLNCRYTPNGKIRSRIPRGAILTAVFNKTAEGGVPSPFTAADDAIALDNNGLPWLRVIGTQEELAYPVPPLTFSDLGQCYVRANLKYIAPINPDAIGFDSPKTSSSICPSKSLYCSSRISQWLSLR